MKRLAIIMLGVLFPLMASAQYAQVRDTDHTKFVTVTELPNFVYHNLGRVGDGVFFLGDMLMDMEGNVIAKDLRLSNSIRGNGLPVFSNGKATFDNGEKMGILDKTGKIVWSVKKGYGESISAYFSGGYATKVTVKQNIPYREYINDKGTVIFPALTRKCTYGSSFNPEPFVDGLARFYDPVKLMWGFINEKGAIVIPAKYREAHPFSEGLAAVKLESSNNWGFINTKGELVIKDMFSREPEDFVGGCAVAEKNDGTSLGYGEKVLINTAGEVFSAGWKGRVFRFGELKFVQKDNTPEYFGYILDKDGKELEYGEEPSFFISNFGSKYWPRVFSNAEYALTQNNLRDKNLGVLFISKATFPVDGRDGYWFNLYDAGDGYIWIADDDGAIHGIVNEIGEVVIHFKKSEF